VSIIGTVQAAEALKLLAGVGTSLAGRLQCWMANDGVERDPPCASTALHGWRAAVSRLRHQGNARG
jgi:hypothetical protein